MRAFETKLSNTKTVLALGAESAGNFSVFSRGIIYFSKDFGDLLEDTNFNEYKHELNEFLKKNKIKPDIILTDLHPLYKTTILGQKLAKKYNTKHIQVQHHLAHIFSAIGDKILQTKNYKLQTSFGIAMDGTGYGTDGKIWGGEVFKVKSQKLKVKSTERIGHLENQMLIGGDLAIQEPARMLISIIDKIYPSLSLRVRRSGRGNPEPNRTKKEIAAVVSRRDSLAMTNKKNFVYSFVKKFYTRNEFEVLYSQLQQNFNCIETSSTGRILDAVSILLGFAGNKRNYKHEPIDLLEKNSTKPYALKPVIIFDKKENQYILQTTPLFEYLIKNLNQDKNLPADEAGRLAATAQLYIAKGLYKIIKKNQKIYIAGGISNNKIISSFLESQSAYANKKIPRGDAGISLGQTAYFLYGS